MRFPSSSAERRLLLMVALAPGVNLSTSSHEAFRQLSLRIARVCTVRQCASTSTVSTLWNPTCIHTSACVRLDPSKRKNWLEGWNDCGVVGRGWRRCAKRTYVEK